MKSLLLLCNEEAGAVLQGFGQAGLAGEGGGTHVLLQVPLAKTSGRSKAAFVSETVFMP